MKQFTSLLFFPYITHWNIMVMDTSKLANIFWWKTNIVKYCKIYYKLNIFKFLLHYALNKSQIYQIKWVSSACCCWFYQWWFIAHKCHFLWMTQLNIYHKLYTLANLTQLQRHFIWTLTDPFKDPSSVQFTLFIEKIVQFNFRSRPMFSSVSVKHKNCLPTNSQCSTIYNISGHPHCAYSFHLYN